MPLFETLINRWDTATAVIVFLAVAIPLIVIFLVVRAGWIRLAHDREQLLHESQLQAVQLTERLAVMAKLERMIEDLEYERSDLGGQLAIRQAQVAELSARLQADRTASGEKLQR